VKRDYNYIAAVEKAIAEKYGKDTVQDFRSTWEEEKEKDYLNQLTKRREKLLDLRKKKEYYEVGNLEIKSNRRSNSKDRACPVCKTYSFSSKDDLYMNRFECCNQCYITYVEFREERWKSGWRPGDGDWRPPLLKRVKRYFNRFFSRLIWRIKKWLPS
tara:strand:+ start:676 stop:1149 length:474 start_codon:yes stop_codon:yes gene_type:complete